MKNGYRIIDADRHVIEPPDLWATWLEPELRRHALTFESAAGEPLEQRIERLGPLALVPTMPRPVLDGKPLWNRMSERAWIEMSAAAFRSAGQTASLVRPSAHLAEMDRSGIDIACLYPTNGLMLEGVSPLPPGLGSAFARAYNSWLREFCSADPSRLRGVALISRHDPEGMAAEVERAASFGWTAVVVRPTPIGGRLLSDPSHEPLWEACERLSMGVALHEGSHGHIPTIGVDRFHSHMGIHACAHPMEQMAGLLALIEGGVLERHPRLRIAALEAGCGWLPYWLFRLDEEYAFGGKEIADRVRLKPSAYFRRQGFVMIEPSEPYLAEMAPFIGVEHLLFGTDFPHADHGPEILDATLRLRDRLGEEALRRMLWDNPARFYGVSG
jgi:uncharacterized protein